MSSSSCPFPFPLRQPTAQERWWRSVRTHPPSNSASRQTGSSQVKSLPGYFPSPWHFPQSLKGFPRSTSLTNHFDRKSPLKVSFWSTGSKSSVKTQSLEITGRDLKSRTPMHMALQQLVFYTLGLSLLQTPTSHLLIPPSMCCSLHLSYWN